MVLTVYYRLVIIRFSDLVQISVYLLSSHFKEVTPFVPLWNLTFNVFLNCHKKDLFMSFLIFKPDKKLEVVA